MQERDYYIKEFNNIYRIFVGSLLGVILISQLIIQYYINSTKNDASIINIAGMQRMMSQDIAKTVLNIRLDILQNHSAAIDSRQLRDLVRQFDENHHEMLYGKKTLGARINDNPVILKEVKELQTHFLAISLNANLIAHDPGMAGGVDTYVQRILANESPFLQTMEKIVFTYNQEGLRKTRQLQLIEVVLAVITFVLIMLEMLYLYRPMISRLQKRNWALQAQYRRIQHFMFVISHNIRKPVANLIGLTNVFDSADPSETEIVSNIRESATELDTIIRDLNRELSDK